MSWRLLFLRSAADQLGKAMRHRLWEVMYICRIMILEKITALTAAPAVKAYIY